MNQQRNNQVSSDSTNQDVFSDFDPPSTTDGSYMGTMKRVKATEDHLQGKFQEKLEEVQATLKQAKCRVGLKVTGGSIQLQATLPPKPGSDKIKPYQQLISLGTPANLTGLITAQEDAFELGRLLARKQFEWNEKYLGKKNDENKVYTIGELLDKFESQYYATRQRTINSDTTFNNYKTKIARHFEDSDTLAQSTVDKRLGAIVSPSSRSQAAISLSVLSKVFKIDIDVSEFSKKNYKKQSRSIPTDEQIIECFGNYAIYANNRSKRVNEKDYFNWQLYQWIYGMMATYGLRPRELFLYPDIDWWLSPENTDNTWKVHKACKTGTREAFPLHQQWVDFFDLKSLKHLTLLKKFTENKSTFTHFESSVNENGKWFKKVGIFFKPYDLRHAWAIRAHLMGVPIKAAADNLGHSVDMHTQTYQQWFGRENRKNAINQAIAKKSEVDILREENTRLNIEVERLKLEVERYRLMTNHPEFIDR